MLLIFFLGLPCLPTFQVFSDVESLTQQRTNEKSLLVKVEGLPDKARRQAEAVSGVLKNVQGQVSGLL